jgi:hypothetical protein
MKGGSRGRKSNFPFQVGLVAGWETAGFGLKEDVVKDRDMQEV